MTKAPTKNARIKQCVVYGVITRKGHLLPSTMRHTRAAVIDAVMREERRYYLDAPHTQSWSKARKRWGYRIARIDIGGPVYAR